jgi:hypothetical protein
MEIIVPAAGLSTRFPNMKPKYLLYDYKHELMLKNALRSFTNHSITIGILKEHEDKYQASKFINYEFGSSVKIVIIDEPTKGPADTVYQILQRANINDDAEIFIKDCDSYFTHELTSGSYVCTTNISEHEVLKRLSAKSFIIYNEQDIITDIIEKKVVSDTFCVGGYKFGSAAMFKSAFETIKQENEVFVSDVIGVCLNNNVVFTKKSVTNYIDVGTAKEWFEQNDKPVIFCDIDGTIIMNQAKVGDNNYNQEAIPLQSNVKRLLELQEQGAQFIFTTARSKLLDSITQNLLSKLGFKNFTLVSGLLNSKRILINDFNDNNPYPRAEAINLKRNSDELSNFL